MRSNRFGLDFSEDAQWYVPAAELERARQYEDAVGEGTATRTVVPPYRRIAQLVDEPWPIPLTRCGEPSAGAA